MNIYNKEILQMAVIKKTLFAENLDRYQTFVTDTNPNSEYFKITELSDTFTGGKNAFLIQGSEYLVSDTLIKIEIKDAKGNIIYHEPGEGIISASVAGEQIITEYYEGVSKVVAVYVYPDTAYGPCTLTILGEISSYNNNGLISPIPSNWEGQYNVKWQKQINVNPSLANTTKIRFYKRPTASIRETLSPIYTIISGSKVQSNIVSSFANIKLSQMETFAGDVKRIKVFRTSLGDISDSDLIQDILVESKELLTSYELSGSVIGNGGLFTSETLQKLWTATGLTTQLTSSRIDNGVKLNGSGYFKYTSSLNLSDVNVYELGVDAFYSSSTASNLGIYISGSNNGEYLIGTLNGITPTKNLKDQTIQFTLPNVEPSASLYFSQSQSEWHIGNVSLKLTQDTAFSPSEIEFVTSMPTVIGNETYEFNFEFYDVNNNYVPVAVTQSALFTGGNNNLGGTLIFISSSASSSLAQLNAVSSSISGTVTFNSASVSSSITTLSGSVSGSITSLSSSVSSSITSLSSSVSQSSAVILSSSFSKVQQLANGQFSGSFIGDTVIYSPVLGGQQGYFSEKFQVGNTNPIVLDATTSTRKIYVGTGTYNNTNTSVYMDSGGQFSLGDKLTYNGSTLTVNGNINVTGGNAATQTYANTIGTNAVTSGSAAATSAAAAVDDKVFTNALGRITKAPTPGSTSGLYLGNTIMGFYNGNAWKTYMDNTGLFYLTGSANGNALLWDGSTLTIKGNLAVGSAVPNSVVTGLGTLATKNTVAAATDVTGLGGLATKSSVTATEIDAGAVTNAKIAADAVTEAKLAANAVTSGKISANAVVADKIAADAIVADKIAAGAITAGKISAGAITADKISAGAIEADKIAAGAITAGKIAAGAVTADKVDVAGVISAGSIVVGGSPISALSNNSGYQANGSAKTAGSVGGWSINSSAITSNNGQTVLNNTGVISLTDGTTERIKITKDNLSTNVTLLSNSTSQTGANNNLTSTTGTSWSYLGTRNVSYTSDLGVSSPFSISQDALTLAVSYQGSSTGQSGGQVGIGTAFQSNILSIPQYSYSTFLFRATLFIYLQENINGTWFDVSYQTKEIYRESISSTSAGGAVSTGYGAGVTSAAFGGLNPANQHRVVTSITWAITNSAIAYTFSSSLGFTWTLSTVQYAIPAQTFSITAYQLATKLEIGLNGIQISSGGGLTAIGAAAGSGLAGTFTGDVKVQGSVQAAAFVSTSDERLKTDIKEIDSPMVKLSQLNPKSFLWNDATAPLSDKGYSYGFIAQDVQNYFPELVKVVKDSTVIDDLLTIEYNAIIALNTAAIKQLVSKIEVLEDRILQLEEQTQ